MTGAGRGSLRVMQRSVIDRLRRRVAEYATAAALSYELVSVLPAATWRPPAVPYVRIQRACLEDGAWNPREVVPGARPGVIVSDLSLVGDGLTPAAVRISHN